MTDLISQEVGAELEILDSLWQRIDRAVENGQASLIVPGREVQMWRLMWSRQAAYIGELEKALETAAGHVADLEQELEQLRQKKRIWRP